VKGEVKQKLMMKGQLGWAMGGSSCIFPMRWRGKCVCSCDMKGH
jgi:hypothetical protein